MTRAAPPVTRFRQLFRVTRKSSVSVASTRTLPSQPVRPPAPLQGGPKAGVVKPGPPGRLLDADPQPLAPPPHFLSGPGAGTYTFTNYRPVSFTGVERLTGPDYTRPAVVSASFVPAPLVEVEFLFSEDVRNSLQPQDLLLTHLETGQNLTASGFMDLVFRSAPGAGVPTRAAWVQRDLQT